MMTFDQALQRLAHWVAESGGTPIRLRNGTLCAFERHATYPEQELRVFEEDWSLALPDAYRRFLREVGASRLFFNAWPKAPEFGEIQFVALERLYQTFAECFEEPVEALFGKFLPVGFDGYHQELLVFASERETPANFMRVGHESHPDDWVDDADELDSWMSFEDYVIALVRTEGRIPL